MNNENKNVESSICVVIAAYNEEKFIGRCLRSLLNQSLEKKFYEIIVVDDGSTDKTNYALSLFRDPNNSILKIITNKKNIGLPASLNHGIKHTTAKYIIRVDGDDFVNKNFLEILRYYLDSNPEADAVACDYYLLNDKEEVIKRMDCKKNPIACGIMFRRDQMIEVGLYDEDFLYQEEKEFRIRFEKKFKINRLELPMYRYRMHEKNITKDTFKMDFYYDKIINKHS